jgi:hypothetical protein
LVGVIRSVRGHQAGRWLAGQSVKPVLPGRCPAEIIPTAKIGDAPGHEPLGNARLVTVMVSSAWWA